MMVSYYGFTVHVCSFVHVWSCLIILLDWMDLGRLGCPTVSERAWILFLMPMERSQCSNAACIGVGTGTSRFRVHSHYRHRLCERPGRRLMVMSKHSKDYNADRLAWRSLPGYLWPISGGFFPVNLSLCMPDSLHQSRRSPFVFLDCAKVILILTCTTISQDLWHILTYLTHPFFYDI